MKPKKISQEKISVDEAFTRHSKIVNRENTRRGLLLENVEDLVKMFDTQQYKVILGFDPEPHWSGYLAQVEVYYSRAEVERWRKIWRRLVQELKIKPEELILVPVTRLEDIARFVRSTNEAEEMLGAAKINTPQDWKDTLAKYNGQPTSLDCDHKGSKIFKICGKCGIKHVIEVNINALNESQNSKI